MLLYKYTDNELKALLKTITIIVDTREQRNGHITHWLDSNKIPYVDQKLDAGDYSCFLPANPALGIPRDMYFTDIVAIERKANLGELSSNLTADRTRIENEFIRAKGKIYLMIENADYSNIIRQQYNSKYTPKAFIATIKTFEARYNINTVYMQNQEYSGSFIYNTLMYHVREALKG